MGAQRPYVCDDCNKADCNWVISCPHAPLKQLTKTFETLREGYASSYALRDESGGLIGQVFVPWNRYANLFSHAPAMFQMLQTLVEQERQERLTAASVGNILEEAAELLKKAGSFV